MLGIYYLDYCDRPFPRSARQMIIGYTKADLLKKIKNKNIPDNWFCWFKECETPGYIVEGDLIKIKDWICKHMPDNFGEQLVT